MSLIIEQSDIKADFHTHTIASLHAYSTLKENIDAAKELGQQFMAVTEHFIGEDDALQSKYELSRIKTISERTHKLRDFRVIDGVELNFGQQSEQLEGMKDIAIRLGGLHSWYWSIKHQDIEALKRIVKDYIDRGYINVVAHPEREINSLLNGKYGEGITPAVKEYFEWLVTYTKKKRVFLEVNEYSASNDIGGNRTRLEYWLKLARDNNNPIVLGSDAHFYTEVGLFDKSIRLLNKLGYPKGLILNCSVPMINEIFPQKYMEEEFEDDEQDII